MKLTIEHLAPYLPYGLKVSKIHTLNTGNGIGSIDHIIDSVNKGMLQYRPILRPLSDITKEFEVGDEIFVPFHAIKYLHPNTPNWNIYWRDWVIEKSHPLVDTHIEYCIMQLLFKYHFDVFGLIDKGLAIDINTSPPSQ